MPAGRPTDYSQDLADKICLMIASGKSMRAVCREDSMPCMTTIFRWLREKKEFRQQYDLATEERAEAHVEEMLEIADDGTNDYVEQFGDDTSKQAYRVNGEAIQRSRLRVDTRKWAASKMKPKKYGNIVDLNVKSDEHSREKLKEIEAFLASNGVDVMNLKS